MAWLGNLFIAVIAGFIDEVEAGTEEGVRIEVDRIRESEKFIEAHKRRREKRTAFWTTPGLRPLAEPLILDWDWFLRERMPTDARFKALLPDDAEERARMKDIWGEYEALSEYSGWALIRKDDPEDLNICGDARDENRRKFYGRLHEDLNTEKDAVGREYDTLLTSASNLGQFEYTFLDDDGIGTKRIEEYIYKGAHIFRGWDAEVQQKYQHLVPPDYIISQLATFEWLWLDRDGGVTRMKSALRAGEDFFRGWKSEDVARRYGHLRKLLPGWARWSGHMVDKYGWRDWWLGRKSTVHEHSDFSLCVDLYCKEREVGGQDIDTESESGDEDITPEMPYPLLKRLYESYAL